jgi:hypothetical protein
MDSEQGVVRGKGAYSRSPFDFAQGKLSATLGRCDFIDLSGEVLDFKQNRHPERSALQIYRVTQGLVARSRRTPRVLIYPWLLEAFQPLRAGGPATVHEEMYPRPSSAYSSRSCSQASVVKSSKRHR